MSLDSNAWNKEWGIDPNYSNRGGLAEKAEIEESPREVYLLQRKEGKVGAGLGKTSGWTHRLSLKHKKVKMLNHVHYEKIDDQGLHILVGGDKASCLEVDNIVICAGQTSNQSLFEELKGLNKSIHIIGGADVAVELDAKRAIKQAAELASCI